MRADTVLLKPSEEQKRDLERIALHTSLLWNEANYQHRQAFLRKQKIPSYSTQCRHFKRSENFKAIGTGKGQAVLKKLDEAWRSFWALKRLQSEGRLPSNIRKVRMPGYLKDKNTKQTILRAFLSETTATVWTGETLQ